MPWIIVAPQLLRWSTSALPIAADCFRWSQSSIISPMVLATRSHPNDPAAWSSGDREESPMDLVQCHALHDLEHVVFHSTVMDAAVGTKECSAVREFLEEWSEDDGDREDRMVMFEAEDLGSPDATSDAAGSQSPTPSDQGICRENRSTASSDRRLIDAMLSRKIKHVSRKWKSTYARRKHEIAELEIELQQLQDKLARLQAGHTGGASASSAALTPRQYPSTLTVADTVVLEKRLAGRERELLLRSLLQNEKLRTFLADQRLMAKSLDRILARRVEKAAVSSPQWSQRGFVSDDELVFSALLEETAFMGAEADRIAHTSVKTPAAST